MAAGAWTFTDMGRTYLLNGTLDLDTDTFAVSLYTSSATPASMTTYTTTNELATLDGYTQGGFSLGTLSLSGTTTVTVDDAATVQWAATGSGLTARYAVIHNGTNVMCYCLLDSAPANVTASAGNNLTVNFHASGIFTLA